MAKNGFTNISSLQVGHHYFSQFNFIWSLSAFDMIKQFSELNFHLSEEYVCDEKDYFHFGQEHYSCKKYIPRLRGKREEKNKKLFM